MPTNAGGYSLTGNALTFLTRLAGLPASCVLTGYPSSYARDFEAWFPLPFDGDNWAVSVIENEAWSSKLEAARTWLALGENTKAWTPAVKQPENWTNE